MEFELLSRDGAARRGRLSTAHGVIETPAFMPVGTQGAVKGLTPGALEETGAAVMLANLYHLALRPGIDTIVELGGLHRFTGWDRPILTDSGGFQIFSLSGLRRVSDAGVRFRSHLDGEALELTPESVVRDQARMGVDIAMVLDECPPWPISERQAAESLRRTELWARRSLAVERPPDTALFGIVQGSFYANLRAEACAGLAELGFDGIAIGGVSVGEDRSLGRRVVEECAGVLPQDKPRYLMGLGTPADIVHAVQHGVDLFDCVLPARNARHGVLFTRQGVLRLKNARFAADAEPVDADCGCPVCRRVPRAFLHHLLRRGEVTAKVMATLHNVRFYLDFMHDLRQAAASGTLSQTAARIGGVYPLGESVAGSPGERESLGRLGSDLL